MEVVKLNSGNKIKILTTANEIINRGGTVVYPTETAYGLGADFFEPQAYAKVLQIKGRPDEKALPVIVPDIRVATSIAEFSPIARQLAEKYWPGPLTLVLPIISSVTNPLFKEKTIALRVSSHPFAQDLVRVAARPLISTSANLSGSATSYSVPQFVRQLQSRSLKPDLIIDSGNLPQVPPSTIVSVIGDEVQVLRQGPVKIK